MAVKRAHLIGSTNIYREVADNNAQEIISEGFSNVFVENPLENDSINKLKRKSQKQAPPAKKTHILKWKFLNDEKAIADEWIINDHSITKSFLDFKNMAISLANEGKLTYAAHPSEILSLNSIFLMEENSIRTRLDIPPSIRKQAFGQMKILYQKNNLNKFIKDFCHECADISRENDKDKFEDSVEQLYYKLKSELDDPDKKLLRKCQNVWKHLSENWKTSFDGNKTIEDTHVHELLHPLLKPFFTLEQGRDINWANKMSMSSAERKSNEEGDGHKPDFMISVDINSGTDKFEILYGLFKSPIKANTYLVNIDLVDLGILMKDSLNKLYTKYVTELDMAVFGIHCFGHNLRIYGMDLTYDGLYRMYMLGEFELPRSNISYPLVEYALYEIENLRSFVEEYIRRIPPYLPPTDNYHTPTKKQSMIRSTISSPKKIKLQ